MTGYVLKLSYDQDRAVEILISQVNKDRRDDSLSTVGRLRQGGSEEALSLGLSSSLSLVIESGLRALLAEVGPLHALESDALELLCILSLTSGTKSLPWIAGGRRVRSRLGGDRETDWVSEGELSVGVEGWGEGRQTDRRWNDWENFAIISSDRERCEGGACAERSADEHETRDAGWEEAVDDAQGLSENSG